MAQNDMPEPIDRPEEPPRSCPEVLLEWAMETCGVEEPGDLLDLLDEGLTEFFLVDGPDDQLRSSFSCWMHKPPRSFVAAAGVFWLCQKVSELQESMQVMRSLAEEDACLSGSERQDFLRFCDRVVEDTNVAEDDLRRRLITDLALLEKPLVERDPHSVLLLTAGLLTLLIGEARRAGQSDGIMSYGEDVRELLQTAKASLGLLDPDYVLDQAIDVRWINERGKLLVWRQDRVGQRRLVESENKLGFSLGAAACVIWAEYAAFRAWDEAYEEAFLGMDNLVGGLALFGLFRQGLDIPHLGAPFGFGEGQTISDGVLELMSVWEKLHAAPYREEVRNWDEIARTCEELAACFSIAGVADVEVEADLSLNAYWWRAQAHARDQMSPSQLHALLKMERAELNMERAQLYRQRLRSDFFDDSWDHLENSTRECLISAEMACYSSPHMGGRVFAALNELRLAFEYELREMFIKPIEEETESILRDRERRKRLGLHSRDAGSINLRDVATLLERAHPKSLDLLPLHRLIEKAGLNAKDKRFVRQELPRFLKRLWEARNKAEHEGRCDAGIMRALRREALGIGCEGMLPRLARLKQKLARTGDSRLLPGRS